MIAYIKINDKFTIWCQLPVTNLYCCDMRLKIDQMVKRDQRGTLKFQGQESEYNLCNMVKPPNSQNRVHQSSSWGHQQNAEEGKVVPSQRKHITSPDVSTSTVTGTFSPSSAVSMAPPAQIGTHNS